MNPRYNSTPN